LQSDGLVDILAVYSVGPSNPPTNLRVCGATRRRGNDEERDGADAIVH